MKQIDPVKARQGRSGYHVLLVLVGGLLLAAVAWFFSEQYGQAIQTPGTADGSGGLTQPPATEKPAQ